MKIRQWLGYNEDASQYLLRAGELRVLNNLQAYRPGMLTARKGLVKIYGKYDGEAIYGIYRRATLLGSAPDFLWLQKVEVPRDLTVTQIAARESPVKTVWTVRRVQGYQARVIDTQDLSPDGSSEIQNFSVAEDRHGRLFIFYGHGTRPRLYRPDNIANVAVDMGLDAPLTAPSVIPSGTGYFIEGVDVAYGGGAYYDPPELTLEGGSPTRHAKLKAIVQAGNVVGVDISDGGANYQSAPTITAALDKVGSGFRARGHISNSARTIEGFRDTAAATVTGTAASATQTYGATNGTDNNSILYQSSIQVLKERVLSSSGATLTLGNVSGIAVGDLVSVYPAAVPFSTGGVTVTAVNVVAKTVTISNATWVPVVGTAYDATFTRSGQVSQAAATYNAATRRFSATIPLASSSVNGEGAAATLEFSPKPLGYAINPAGSSSIAVTNSNFQTYKNSTTSGYAPYLYDEFWEGSDYDKPKSVENSRYGGLQASGSSYVRGYSGTVDKKRADVYWPDYSKISVWFCEGVEAANANQWTRVDVAVESETTAGGSAKILKFRLRPSQKSKTIKTLNGSAIATGYDSYEELPDAVAPEVKLYLTDCPDSWVVNGQSSLPKSVKEENADRLAWWSPSSGVPRPIVGITPIGTAVDASAVVVTDPGRGWQQGTKFLFRLYQANPYDQYVDYNTAVVEPSVRRGHPAYETGNRYVEFALTADTPDDLTPHGPPNVLLTPATVSTPGSGYVTSDVGSITLYKRDISGAISAAVAAETLQWTASLLDTLSASTTGSIASITILNKGRNYFAPPNIEVRGSGAGYGLSVIPRVANGQIESLQIIDPGTGYTTAPELFTSARAAELTPVMRPAMQGVYRCAYRFVDMSETAIASVTATLGNSSTTLTLSSTDGIKPGMILDSASLPHFSRIKSVNGNQVELNQEIAGLAANVTITATVRDLSKPIGYSDLSPIIDVDAGPNDDRTHCSTLTWSLPGVRPPLRADKVEFWRTSADQSLVFYRLEAYGIPSADGVQVIGTDTLTDEQLFDPERPHYAAMPVVLPNGNVNAYRFGKPRSDLSVAVAFQDRLWMGVSTSGKDANTLYYSEYDEFESVPDVNDLPIQINQKSTDVLTALVPFGSMLLAMQHQHTYSVTYSTEPAIDATIQMMSHRGCMHQRCWDIHENVLYAADESGIYALGRNGEVKDISLPVRNFFVNEILDFGKRDTFFLQVDPRTHVLRFFCTLKTNSTDTPAFALCFDINAGTWWTESYPNSFTASCTGHPSTARVRTTLLGGVDGNLYEIDTDSDHANGSLTDGFITEHGSGYIEAPQITVPNCEGAVVHGVVSEGRLVDLVIQNTGWMAKWGIGILTEAGEPLAAADGRELKGVEYDAIKLDIGPPEPGGIQAEGYVNFAVTPEVVRTCTVSEGEDFVRLDLARITPFEPDSTAILESQAGLLLTTEADEPIATEPAPVEIGMEAVGDYIPLNAFVSRIDRNNIYLRHPDGSPVSMLFGAARANQTGTSADYLELGGTPMVVRFYKPYRTHIPFRMTTGFMQLATDETVKNGHVLMDRSVTLVYSPTNGDKDIELIERFNGRENMQANIMRRDRYGEGGFVHRQDSASTVLNTNSRATRLGFSTGVATAKFASRAYADMTGEGQHIQVELYGRPSQASPWQRVNFWRPNTAVKTPQPVMLHSLNINGVMEDNEQ